MHIDPESNIGACQGVEIQDKVRAGSRQAAAQAWHERMARMRAWHEGTIGN
jgi:hypothetical protein